MKRIRKIVLAFALSIAFLMPTQSAFAAEPDNPLMYLYNTEMTGTLYEETLTNDYWIDLASFSITDKRNTSWTGLYPKNLISPTETANKDIGVGDPQVGNTYPNFGIVNSMMAPFLLPQFNYRYGYEAGYDVAEGELDGNERQQSHGWSDNPITHVVNPFNFGKDDLLTKDEYNDPLNNLLVLGDLSSQKNADSGAIGEYAPGEDVVLDFTLNGSWVRRYLNGSIFMPTRTGGYYPKTDPNAIAPDMQRYHDGIARTDAQLAFTVNVPDGVNVADTPTATLTGLDGFETPQVSKSEDGKLLTITLRKKDPGKQTTLVAVVEAISRLDMSNVKLSINGFKVSPDATEGTQITFDGTAAGFYDFATKTTTTSPNFQGDWDRRYMFFAAQQSDAGRDPASPEDKPKQISYSFKVVKPETYAVTYAFQSDDGSELPKEVQALLPAAVTGQANGTTVTSPALNTTSVEIKDADGKKLGTWNFQGWKQPSVTISGAPVTVTGTWKYTPAAATPAGNATSETKVGTLSDTGSDGTPAIAALALIGSGLALTGLRRKAKAKP